jgi:hypothetical protein
MIPASCATLLAALAAASAGCWQSSKQPDVVPPQTQTFQVVDQMGRQVDAIPDPRKRAELTATLERLRGQLTFGQIPQAPGLHLLMVKEINILPETQVADWNHTGTASGFEVEIEALDHFGDRTKLVGKVLFELFDYRAAHADRKNLTRTAFWQANVESADDCLRFWDRFRRTYHFNLVWAKAPEVGKKYIFQVTYLSPWGEVIETQRTLTRLDR